MEPSKKYQVSEDSYRVKPFPPSTEMKTGSILPMYWDDEVGHHIRSINKPGTQDIFSIGKEERIRGQIYTQKIMRDILLQGSVLSRWQRSPLNFSRWGYC